MNPSRKALHAITSPNMYPNTPMHAHLSNHARTSLNPVKSAWTQLNPQSLVIPTRRAQHFVPCTRSNGLKTFFSPKSSQHLKTHLKTLCSNIFQHTFKNIYMLKYILTHL